MLSLGFSEGWISKIMNYISLSSFSVLINHKKGTNYGATRGLRQGCPLSPFLFIIYAERFFMLIHNMIETASLNGIKVARGALEISHLFFLDNSLLFA